MPLEASRRILGFFDAVEDAAATKPDAWLSELEEVRITNLARHPDGLSYVGSRGSLQCGLATAFFTTELCAGKFVIESGASKTMSSVQLVEEYQQLFHSCYGGAGAFANVPEACKDNMTFANGDTIASVGTARVPVPLGDVYCTADMVLMDGPGPVLLSVNVLEAMGTHIAFKTGAMKLGDGRTIQLDRLPNDHYFIDLYKP